MHPAIHSVSSVPMNSRVTRADVGRRAVLSVSGEIDMASAPLLAAAVDGVLSDGALELWIDLSSTGFMDSSGLHVLVDARRRLRALNRRFAVICPRGGVRRLFEIAGMIDFLPVYDDRSAANLAA
jgi:anti-sigma B factor antagonist